MKKGSIIIALSLLFILASSQGSWCAAERSIGISADRDLKPHLQEKEVQHGKQKVLEVQSPKKLEHGQSETITATQRDVSAMEIKHPRRTVIAHKGGNAGGGAGAGAGGRNMGGGGAVTRPHGSKNGATVPVATSVLALALACGVALSALGC